jgi:hypothetical protein
MVSLTLNPPYHPTTFLERGVAVPFTTPQLLGARVRPGPRTDLELIVPSPSGGRGQYIMPWSAIGDVGRPTLHDRRLQEAIADVRSVTPGAIREAGRMVATEGLAGREARNAAQDAATRDGDARLVANYHLLLALVRQVELPAPAANSATAETPETMECRAKRTVAEVAPRLGLDADGVGRALEELAEVFAAVGIGPDAAAARLPRTLGRVAALQRGLEAWVAEKGDDVNGAAELVRSCAALTASCATATFADARALVSKPLNLLMRWRVEPDAVAAKAARPEWVLDGWEDLCAIWEAAGPARRRAAIAEIAQLAPIIPKEAADWVGQTAKEANAVFRRMVALNHDWRTGTDALDGIARGERLRAAAG